MGCDGGTIPKRDELVRTKKKPEQKDKTADLAFRWRHCAISQEALVQPIMACELGRLYNKESVLEFLIDRSKFECAASFEHLRGLKDVKELQLTENPAAKVSGHAEVGDGYIDMQVADYICPVSGLGMTGKFRFCFPWICGCVFSERALKEIKTKSCHKCGKPFNDNDIVALNGGDEETTENRYKMDYRRVQAKLAKKAKKSGKHSAAENGEGASCPKKPREDTESSTSGAATTSKLTNGSTSHKPEPSTSSSSTVSKLTIGAAIGSKLPSGSAIGSKLPSGSAIGSKLPSGSAIGSKLPSGSAIGSKLPSGSAIGSKLPSGSKLLNGKLTNGSGAGKDKAAGTAKGGKSGPSIQNDPKTSAVYKSLFNTCEKAKNQLQGNWVTFNPQYFN